MAISAIISLLISICILALIVYVIFWVLESVLSIALPAQIKNIVWIIVALIALAWLLDVLLGGAHMPRMF